MNVLRHHALSICTTALLGLSAADAQAAACKVYFHGSGNSPAYEALLNDGVSVDPSGQFNITPLWQGLIPGYDAIWFQYQWSNDTDPAVRQLLQNFVAAGKGIHMSLDYNQPSEGFLYLLNQRLTSSAGGQNTGLYFGQAASDYSLNPNAVAQLASQPFMPPSNFLFNGSDSGSVLNGPLPARNRLAYHYDLAADPGDVVMAAFDTNDMVDGKGRLSFFGNSGAIQPSGQQSTLLLLLRNLQAFLLAPSTCQAPLEAVPDGGTVTSLAGGQAVANVLDNDYINQATATKATKAPYNLKISEVPGFNTSPASHPIALDTTTGAVNVLPGTPAGDYVLRYQICQVSKPANCEQADINVKVTAGPPTQLALTQTANQHPIGATHTATAKVQDSLGNPIAGAPVTFTVSSGPNAGQTQMVNADAQGVAVFSYVGAAQAGTDAITATTPDGGSSTLTATPLQVDWLMATGLVLSQPTDTHAVGQTHVATATVTDNQGTPMANVTVTFAVTAGPNTGQTITATTNAQGIAQWQYQGGTTPGVDTLVATMPAGAATVSSNSLQVTWTQTVTPPVAGPTPVPTLSGWALLALSGLLGGLAGLRGRKTRG